MRKEKNWRGEFKLGAAESLSSRNQKLSPRPTICDLMITYLDGEVNMQYQEYDYGTTTGEAWTDTSGAAMPNNNAQLMPLTPNPLVRPAAVISAEAAALGAMLQTVQQTQTQQMYLMRQLDTRLTHLEQMARTRSAQAQQAGSTLSFERATWWAIWGLLMLVLGGALAVVLILLLLNIQFR